MGTFSTVLKKILYGKEKRLQAGFYLWKGGCSNEWEPWKSPLSWAHGHSEHAEGFFIITCMWT